MDGMGMGMGWDGMAWDGMDVDGCFFPRQNILGNLGRCWFFWSCFFYKENEWK